MKVLCIQPAYGLHSPPWDRTPSWVSPQCRCVTRLPCRGSAQGGGRHAQQAGREPGTGGPWGHTPGGTLQRGWRREPAQIVAGADGMKAAAVWLARNEPLLSLLPFLLAGGQQRADDPLAEQPNHRDAAALQQRGRGGQRRADKPLQLPPARAARAQQRWRHRCSSCGPARPGSGRSSAGWAADSEHLSHSCNSRLREQRWWACQQRGGQHSAARQRGRQHRRQCVGISSQGPLPQQLLCHPLWRSSSSCRRRSRWRRLCGACRRGCRSQPGPGGWRLPAFWWPRSSRACRHNPNALCNPGSPWGAPLWRSLLPEQPGV